ncbi:MAG TPA: tetratricopeptide repeat protein [Chitinophagaceae bacterium]|jgi:tetratricopeptide (TPR) repeat protein|nr:tetratricopeptide repeat protein [Chitinophagaceae bacterium]
MYKLLLTIAILVISYNLVAQSDSAAFYLNKSIEEKNKGRVNEALKHIEKAYSFNKNDKAIIKELADTYNQSRRYAQAREKYQQLEKMGEGTAATYKQIMLLSFNMRQFDEVIKYADLLKKADPTEKVNYYIGKAQYDREHYGEAIKYLDAAAKEEPARAEIPYMVARAYADMLNYKQAVTYFQKALAIDPNQSSWIYEMALMYYGMHDDQNSLKYMLEAGEKGLKRDNEYLENLGIAYLNAKKVKEGLSILAEVLERRPSDLNLLNMIAEACYDAQRYAEAIEYWDRVLAIDTSNASALYMIGLSYQRKGEKEKGVAICDRAIQMDPSLAKNKQKKSMPGL